MNNSRVDSALNSICGQGCRYVNKVLNDEQAQLECRELFKLDRSDRNTVIEELKLVMSVYDKTGSCSI